ncbi:MAG TPA: hypothetical protein VJH90_00825 [archaeon]|nr:hypothetical protein [archaeon]
MISAEDAKKRVEDGCLKFWVLFEVLAVSEQVAKESLEKMIKKVESDKRVEVYKREFSNADKRENPLPNIKIAYAQSCEMEGVAKSMEELVEIVLEYGPSAIEILEPSKMQLSSREAQNILNSMSEMMHRFAAAGAGGLVFLNK